MRHPDADDYRTVLSKLRRGEEVTVAEITFSVLPEIESPYGRADGAAERITIMLQQKEAAEKKIAFLKSPEGEKQHRAEAERYRADYLAAVDEQLRHDEHIERYRKVLRDVQAWDAPPALVEAKMLAIDAMEHEIFWRDCQNPDPPSPEDIASGLEYIDIADLIAAHQREVDGLDCEINDLICHEAEALNRIRQHALAFPDFHKAPHV